MSVEDLNILEIAIAFDRDFCIKDKCNKYAVKKKL
jgi:hypothetical protein